MADFGSDPTKSSETQIILTGYGAGGIAIITAGVVLSQVTDSLQQGLSEIVETVKESKTLKYQYWQAWRDKNGVHIGRGLTFGEAALRVACGFDVMCANQDAARWILVVNGYWFAVGPEIHGDEGFFMHYHPHRHTHTHIWYFD